MAMTDDREPGSVSVTDNAHADATSSAHVVFTALRGGVGVIRDGERVAIGGPQQQRLLAALLAAKGTAVSADRLADTIWPDGAMPDGARRTVMSYVSRLRATIGGDYVVTGANGYQLVNGVAMHAENPENFHIPPDVIKRHVTRGQFVELRIDSPKNR